MLYIYKQKGSGRFAFSLTNKGNKIHSRQGTFTLIAETESNKETHSGWLCRKKLLAAQNKQNQQNGDVSGEDVIATDLFGQFEVLTMSEFTALC